MAYINNDELTNEVINLQQTGVMSDRLVVMLSLLAANVSATFGAAPQMRDDISQDFLMQILRKYHLLNPKKNLFSYLTTIVRNITHVKQRKHRQCPWESLADVIVDENNEKTVLLTGDFFNFFSLRKKNN